MKKHITINGIYNQNYSVDHNGNVFNKEGHTMKPSYTHDGYQRVRLQRGCPRKMYRVHRIVCESFYGLNAEKPVVNHLNGIRDDNRLENLEWCTTKDNNTDVNAPVNKRKFGESIYKYTLKGELLAIYKTYKEASISCGVSANNISRACRGFTKSSGGYLWKVF